MQRYTHFKGGGVPIDQAEFEALFNGLRAAWASGHEQLGSYGDWKNEALQRCKRDAGLAQLLKRNSSYILSASTNLYIN